MCEYHRQSQASPPCFLSCPHPSTPLGSALFISVFFPEFLLPGESSPCTSDSFVLNSYGVSTTPHRLPPPKSLMWKSVEAVAGEGAHSCRGVGDGQGCVQQPRGISRASSNKGGIFPGWPDRLPPGTCFLWGLAHSPSSNCSDLPPRPPTYFLLRAMTMGFGSPTSPSLCSSATSLGHLPGGHSGPGSPASPK